MSNISLILSYNSILFLSHSSSNSGSDCVCLSLFTSKRETYWEMFSVAPLSSICLLETTLAKLSMSLYSLCLENLIDMLRFERADGLVALHLIDGVNEKYLASAVGGLLHTAYQQARLHRGGVE